MRASTRALTLVVPVVLIGLVITSGITLYRIRSLSLPVSRVIATASILLPVLTGVSIRSAQTITRRGKSSFSKAALAVLVLLIIYETVIGTLALSHMTPPGNLNCGLERQWASLYSSKNAEAIRRIQDRHQCCGLRSVMHEAWPFPDRTHNAASCQTAFNRNRSCLGRWRQDEQVTGGLILMVAIGTFLLKLILLVIYRSHNPLFSTVGDTPAGFIDDDSSPDSEDHGRHEHRNRRQIEGQYRDNPLLEQNEEGATSQVSGRDDPSQADRGPIVQPSRLQDEENEWRQA